MKPRKLPYKKFLESFKYAPRAAVNLLIERKVCEIARSGEKFRKLLKPGKEVLLTKRKQPPFAGCWHLPGSFILKGEALTDCVNRVAEEELGVEVESVRLAGAFDDIIDDPRGHVVDLVYRCQVSQGLTPLSGVRPFVSKLKPIGDTAEISFFQKLPAKIGFNHRETLVKLGYK